MPEAAHQAFDRWWQALSAETTRYYRRVLRSCWQACFAAGWQAGAKAAARAQEQRDRQRATERERTLARRARTAKATWKRHTR